MTFLRQRGKVLRDLCSIGEQRGHQSGERTQQDDAHEDDGLQRAKRERIPDEDASRPEHRRTEVGDAVSTHDAGDAPDDGERRGRDFGLTPWAAGLQWRGKKFGLSAAIVQSGDDKPPSIYLGIGGGLGGFAAHRIKARNGCLINRQNRRSMR